MFVTVRNTSGLTGPFDIYYDTVSAATVVTLSVTSASLANGYDINVPDATTSIIVVNNDLGCTNQQVMAVTPQPVIQDCILEGTAVYIPPTPPTLYTHTMYLSCDAPSSTNLPLTLVSTAATLIVGSTLLYARNCPVNNGTYVKGSSIYTVVSGVITQITACPVPPTLYSFSTLNQCFGSTSTTLWSDCSVLALNCRVYTQNNVNSLAVSRTFSYSSFLYKTNASGVIIERTACGCQRPTGLTTNDNFAWRISYDAGATFTNVTATNACPIATLYNASSPNLVVGRLSAQLRFALTDPQVIGTIPYTTSTAPDCTALPDGYYITDFITRQITRILNGVINSVTYCPAPASSVYTMCISPNQANSTTACNCNQIIISPNFPPEA